LTKHVGSYVHVYRKQKNRSSNDEEGGDKQKKGKTPLVNTKFLSGMKVGALYLVCGVESEY